jgi:trans-aconitate 2-methyltransferase
MTVQWDPDQYLRYADERGRPFGDLLARVGASDPRLVVDVGCGPGNLTRTLRARWPQARVVGVDSSAEMVRAARADVGSDALLSYEQADLRDWPLPEDVDVVVCNATLQWVPDHVRVLDRWATQLGPGAWLAFQVPGNFDAPSHLSMAEVRTRPRWRDRLASVQARPSVATPEEYLDRLARHGLTVDVWETTYLHVLPGADAVLEWLKGTGLRPVLGALDVDEQADFEAELGELLRAAYPRHDFGTVLPFRRIFAVATREGGH